MKNIIGILLMLFAIAGHAESPFKWFALGQVNGTSWDLASQPAPRKTKSGLVMFYVFNYQLTGKNGRPADEAAISLVFANCEGQNYKIITLQHKASGISEWNVLPLPSVEVVNNWPFEKIEPDTVIAGLTDLACQYVSEQENNQSQKKDKESSTQKGTVFY